MRRFVIDAASDDAVAILMALAAAEVEMLAPATVAGDAGARAALPPASRRPGVPWAAPALAASAIGRPNGGRSLNSPSKRWRGSPAIPNLPKTSAAAW